MKTLLLLLLFCHSTSTVKHSLKFFQTGTSGVENVPEFMAVAMLDEVELGYCENNETPIAKHDLVRKWIDGNSTRRQWCIDECKNAHRNLKTYIDDIKLSLNQEGGAHILQRISGCEWDDETYEITGIHRYGYDGENFTSLNLPGLKWITPTPQALITKHRWNVDKNKLEENRDDLICKCPDLLKIFLPYGRSFLQRKEGPSELLIQNSSSTVRCFASGFYPERASLFWRKDGDDLHEDVKHGEILPNHDGTFQMSVDLNVSSVRPEDRRRYECVFRLSGVKDKVIKLDKTAIWNNWETTVVVVVVVLIVAVLIAAGYKIKKKKEESKPSTKPPAVSVQDKGKLEKDSGSSSSISSAGSENSSTPLMNKK